MKAKTTELVRKRTSPRGKIKPASIKFCEEQKKDKNPLEGKHLFLDLKGYRGAAKLEENLKLLGAKIESSFSTDTNILITSSGSVKDYERRRKSGTAASPGISTPSPFNPGWTRDIDSPQDSPGITEPIKPISRARAIVTKAKLTQNYGSTNIIEWAKQWKIRIVHVEKVKTWVSKELEKLPTVGKDAIKETRRNTKQTQVRRLRGNFVKFEATNHHYKPVQKQLDSAPKVLFDTPVFTCPFERKSIASAADDDIRELRAECEGQDQPCSKKESLNQSAKQQKESSASGEYGGGKLMTAGELRKFIKQKIIKEAKKGYCEMCKVKYDNIDQHVKCESHKQFVKEKSNYSSLDAMISARPNLDQFLDDVIRYHKLHMQEGIKMMAKEDRMSNIKQESNKNEEQCGKSVQKSNPSCGKNNDIKKEITIQDPVKVSEKPLKIDKATENIQAEVKPENKLKNEQCNKKAEVTNDMKEAEPVKCMNGNINTPEPKKKISDKTTKKSNTSHSVIVLDEKSEKHLEKGGAEKCETGVREDEIFIKVSQEENEIFKFSKTPLEVSSKDVSKKSVASSKKSKSQINKPGKSEPISVFPRKDSLTLKDNGCDGQVKKSNDINENGDVTLNESTLQLNEAVSKTPDKSEIFIKGNENKSAEFRNKKCLTSEKRKKRLVKLKQNWSLLSDRSMQKLLMTSENGDEENENFLGFHLPTAKMYQDPPTDVSFVNVDEVELVENSEMEWIVEEMDCEKSPKEIMPKETLQETCSENNSKAKKRKPVNIISEESKGEFSSPAQGRLESPSQLQVMTSTPVQPRKKRILSSDLSQEKDKCRSLEKSPSRWSTRIASRSPGAISGSSCNTPRAANLNAKEKILQTSLSPKACKNKPTAKRKLITTVRHTQKTSTAPCILSLDQVMSMKSKDQSDSCSNSHKGSNKLLKSDRSSKGTSYKFSYLPGCSSEQRKINDKKKAKLKTVLSPKQNQNKNISDEENLCSQLKRKLSPKKAHVRNSCPKLRRSPRKKGGHKKTQYRQKNSSNVTYEFMGSSEMDYI